VSSPPTTTARIQTCLPILIPHCDSPCPIFHCPENPAVTERRKIQNRTATTGHPVSHTHPPSPPQNAFFPCASNHCSQTWMLDNISTTAQSHLPRLVTQLAVLNTPSNCTFLPFQYGTAWACCWLIWGMRSPCWGANSPRPSPRPRPPRLLLSPPLLPPPRGTASPLSRGGKSPWRPPPPPPLARCAPLPLQR